jgi:plastocyanin
VLAALALAVGCGSSSGGASSSAAGTTAKPSTTTTTQANGSSLKVATTPRFATPSKSGPVLSGVVPVAYRNITISPNTVRVRVGSTVRWTNYDPVEHNVTSEGGPQRFASSNFGQGAGFSVRLRKPGVIRYECTNHPTTMNGAIEVVR